MRGTLTTHDDRHSLRFERCFSHPTEEIWRALSPTFSRRGSQAK